MVSAVQEFIGAFDRDKKTMENTLDGVEDSSKLAKKEFNDLDSTFQEIEQSKIDDLSENNNNDKKEEDELDTKFKKKSSANTTGLRRNDKIQKNYEKVSKFFRRNDAVLAREDELLKEEDIVEFTRRGLINKVIKKTFDRNREIETIDQSNEGEKIIILRQKILTD